MCSWGITKKKVFVTTKSKAAGLTDHAPFMPMHKKHTVQSIALGKDTFAVTVYPNVDYAFIISLVVILHEINQEKNDVE
ncbi:protein LURP-one-related 15 [Tanacetum coccineum]